MVTILFDLDGTLIDSTKAILSSFHDTFKSLNFKNVEDEKILSLIGHPLDFMFLHMGVEEKRVEEFVSTYKSFYRQRSKAMTKWLPNAFEAIKEAHKFAKLGVVTTKTGRYSKELLEHMKALKYFEVVIGREDVIHPKPHPEPIIKALNFMNSLKDKSWMIGDTCLDIVSANRAGIKSIAVKSGYANLKELRNCSTHIKECAFEAVKFIEKNI